VALAVVSSTEPVIGTTWWAGQQWAAPLAASAALCGGRRSFTHTMQIALWPSYLSLSIAGSGEIQHFKPQHTPRYRA